jgi:hypothetical protein
MPPVHAARRCGAHHRRFARSAACALALSGPSAATARHASPCGGALLNPIGAAHGFVLASGMHAARRGIRQQERHPRGDCAADVHTRQRLFNSHTVRCAAPAPTLPTRTPRAYGALCGMWHAQQQAGHTPPSARTQVDRRGKGVAGIDAELYTDLDAMRSLATDALDSPPPAGSGYVLPDSSVVVSASDVGEGRAILRYNFSSNDADVAHYHRPNGLSRLGGKARAPLVGHCGSLGLARRLLCCFCVHFLAGAEVVFKPHPPDRAGKASGYEPHKLCIPRLHCCSPAGRPPATLPIFAPFAQIPQRE